MKYLKTFEEFLNEALLNEAKENYWGEKYTEDDIKDYVTIAKKYINMAPDKVGKTIKAYSTSKGVIKVIWEVRKKRKAEFKKEEATIGRGGEFINDVISTPEAEASVSLLSPSQKTGQDSKIDMKMFIIIYKENDKK